MDRSLRLSTSFKCLGSVITDEGSKCEVLTRIAQTTAALTRLKPVWNYRSLSLGSKIRLMRSLVTSILLYASESWTLAAEFQRRIQAMEMRCYGKILHISYNDHVTNEEVRAKIQQAIGPHEDLACSLGLIKAILQRTLKGGRRQGREKKRWERQHQGSDRPGFRQVPEGSGEQGKMEKIVFAKSSVVPQRPSRLRD